jgi:hypothetical protein
MRKQSTIQGQGESAMNAAELLVPCLANEGKAMETSDDDHTD